LARGAATAAPTRLWRVALVLLVAAVCVLAFAPAPPQSLSTGWDKLNHLLAFATLAVAAQRGFPGRRALAGIVLALLGFGAVIEIVQGFVPGREREWADVLADGVGVAIGLLGLMAWRRLRDLPAVR
jgi:VanZ family protein